MAELISLGRLVPALAACFGASYLAFDQVAHRKVGPGSWTPYTPFPPPPPSPAAGGAPPR